MVRQFSKEFKIHAVNLILKHNLKIPQVANNLELDRQTLHRWINEYKNFGDDAFVGNGKRHQKDLEIIKLKKEIEKLKTENIILKKAQAYFAKQQKKN